MNLLSLIPGISQAKAIAAAVGLLALIALGIWIWRVNDLRAKHLAELHTAQQWQANVQQATSHAAGVSGLIALDQVPVQISYLGQSITDLRGKVAEQNQALTDMAASSAAKVAAGNAALAKAQVARQSAQKAVTALRASAAANTGKDGACVPSDAFLANSGLL